MKVKSHPLKVYVPPKQPELIQDKVESPDDLLNKLYERVMVMQSQK